MTLQSINSQIICQALNGNLAELAQLITPKLLPLALG
jgi:hypothetical protein